MRLSPIFGVVLALAVLGGGCGKEPPGAQMSLHEAVTAGNLVQVRRLLSHGVDVNTRDDSGRTLLHSAVPRYAFGEPVVKVGEKTIIQMLLAAGADVDAADSDGVTPLLLTASRGHIKAAKQLLAGGANANAKDRQGMTPLHRVAVDGPMELIERLVARGADVNAVDRDGWTPAHMAAFHGHTAAYEYFAARGADLGIKTNEGKTPLDLAREAADMRVVVLADGKGRPKAAIITSPRATARFLCGNGIDFDRVWIPAADDVGWAGSVLETALATPAELPSSQWFEPEPVRAHLLRYNCEYSGFIKDGRKYVFSNMYVGNISEQEDWSSHSVFLPGDETGSPSNDFVWIWDGGWIAVRAVFDVEGRALTYIECNGQ